MMGTWQPSIINRNRDVENLFALASDHRIFLRSLSFRVYWNVYQKCFRSHKFYFYGEILSPELHFSYFSIPVDYCQLLCRPVCSSKQGTTYNFSTAPLYGILKEINGEGSPLNNYLSAQGDLFFHAKVSCIKLNKLRGHLLSKHFWVSIFSIYLLS